MKKKSKESKSDDDNDSEAFNSHLEEAKTCDLSELERTGFPSKEYINYLPQSHNIIMKLISISMHGFLFIKIYLNLLLSYFNFIYRMC